MKSFVFLLGFLFFSLNATATPGRHAGQGSSSFVFDDGLVLKWMVSCSAGPLTEGGFSLSRHPEDFNLGYLYDYHDGQLVEHIVTINYTNAGARAIITSDNLPTLILVAARKSVIQWDGKTLNCLGRSEF